VPCPYRWSPDRRPRSRKSRESNETGACRDTNLPAVKADLLSRLGRTAEAAAAYRQAFALTTNDAERAFLAEQIADHTLPASPAEAG
jgi:hypothetical protein